MGEVEDEVRLVIPAEPGYLRLARLTAAAVASRMGFNYDQVEDLRIAVDELCHFVLAGRTGPGIVTLTCTIGGDALSITGVAAWNDGSGAAGTFPSQPAELSRRILDAVVDAYQCEGDTAQPRFSLVKRRP